MENGLENTENPESQQSFGSHVGMEVRAAGSKRYFQLLQFCNGDVVSYVMWHVL